MTNEKVWASVLDPMRAGIIRTGWPYLLRFTAKQALACRNLDARHTNHALDGAYPAALDSFIYTKCPSTKSRTIPIIHLYHKDENQPQTLQLFRQRPQIFRESRLLYPVFCLLLPLHKTTPLPTRIFNDGPPQPSQKSEKVRKSRLTFCYGPLYSTPCGFFDKGMKC